MPYSFSTFFTNQISKAAPDKIFKQFFFVNSDHTNHVLDFGSITRDSDKIVAGEWTVEVENTDGFWNKLSDTSFFFQTGQMKIGWMDGNSLDTITMYTGKLVNAEFEEGKVNLQFEDKMEMLNKRIIGTQNSPVNFTGSNWNPADMLWTIATSWGRLSSIQSTTNPDINYAQWQNFQIDCNQLGVRVQGAFEETNVLDSFKKLSRLIEGAIFVDGDGRLYPIITIPNIVTSVDLLMEDHFIDFQLKYNTDKIINKVFANIGYNITSKQFAMSITDQKTSSVNTFGIYEKTYGDKTIWYANTESAQTIIYRVLDIYADPFQKISAEVPLLGLKYVLEDPIQLSWNETGVSNQYYKIRQISYDFDNATISWELWRTEDFDAGNWFFIDDPIQGKLDQTYNKLY